MDGHSLEKLSKILGHASVTTTERYAHLRPEHFKEEDFDAVRVDLSHSGGDVVSICRPGSENGAGGYAVVTGVENGGEKIQITA
jgi:hypothetical protein